MVFKKFNQLTQHDHISEHISIRRFERVDPLTSRRKHEEVYKFLEQSTRQLDLDLEKSRAYGGDGLERHRDNLLLCSGRISESEKTPPCLAALVPPMKPSLTGLRNALSSKAAEPGLCQQRPKEAHSSTAEQSTHQLDLDLEKSRACGGDGLERHRDNLLLCSGRKGKDTHKNESQDKNSRHDTHQQGSRSRLRNHSVLLNASFFIREKFPIGFQVSDEGDAAKKKPK
ncbi:hypothetical protein ACFX19_007225 [Malus domestica]